MRLLFVVSFVASVATSAVADVLFSFNNVNLTATELVTFTVPAQQFVEATTCNGTCSSASTQFQACSEVDCTCSNTTATQLLDCEQCLFEALIQQNVRASDPKLGSQPVLTAFTTGCSAALNTTFETLSLHLPSNWDGPVSLKLSTGVTVIAVGTAFFIASSGLYILWNL